MKERLKARARWWRGALAYDREKGGHYVFLFTIFDGLYRCHHRSKRLGIRCFRLQTYDGWCGLHNSLCHSHEPDTHRCDWDYDLS